MKKKEAKLGHWRMLLSFPIQLTPLSKILPIPKPNTELPTARAPGIRDKGQERRQRGEGERGGGEGEGGEGER